MIRLATFSRSDEFHRSLGLALETSAGMRIELRLRSEREIGGMEWIDAIVVRDDRIEVIDRILDRLAPLPAVIVDAPADVGRWSARLDGFADIGGDDPERIVVSARAVAMGLDVRDAWRPPVEEIDAALSLRPRDAAGATAGELTLREREVLDLLARGSSNAAISEALGISSNTVKYHLTGLFSKLDASSRSEATWMAIKRGLLRL